MKTVLVTLLVGAALGGAGGWYAHVAYARGAGTPAEVLEERREDERLVLVLQADDRRLMATFRDRADDLAEIVHVGDTVVLASAPGVFADEPRVLGVRPPPPPPPEPPARHRRGRAHEEAAAAEPAPVDAGPEVDAHPDLTY